MNFPELRNTRQLSSIDGNETLEKWLRFRMTDAFRLARTVSLLNVVSCRSFVMRKYDFNWVVNVQRLIEFVKVFGSDECPGKVTVSRHPEIRSG